MSVGCATMLGTPKNEVAFRRPKIQPVILRWALMIRVQTKLAMSERYATLIVEHVTKRAAWRAALDSLQNAASYSGRSTLPAANGENIKGLVGFASGLTIS